MTDRLLMDGVREMGRTVRKRNSWVQERLRDGTIPARRDGHRWIVSRREFEAWAEAWIAGTDPRSGE